VHVQAHNEQQQGRREDMTNSTETEIRPIWHARVVRTPNDYAIEVDTPTRGSEGEPMVTYLVCRYQSAPWKVSKVVTIHGRHDWEREHGPTFDTFGDACRAAVTLGEVMVERLNAPE